MLNLHPEEKLNPTVGRAVARPYNAIRMILLLILIAFLIIVPSNAQAQDIDSLLEIDVDAGYDTYFREGFWLPLRITVRNNGDDIIGELTVRPETSGRVVTNAYSTPIDLPNGSQKVSFLYVQVSGFTPRISIELLDSEGARIGEVSQSLIPISSKDKLHVVVTGPTASTIPLNDLHVGGYAAQQATWRIENIPDNPVALQPIDTMILSNVDTQALSSDQQAALTDWLANGGHLLVIGGPGWDETTSGLRDILPFAPDGTETVASLDPLVDYAGTLEFSVDEPAVITTGTVNDNAFILAEVENNPLLVRGNYGDGTVDFLAADPTLEPMVSWEGLPDFWLTVAGSIDPRPAWTQGNLDQREAATAVAVLPGVDLLPSPLALIAFLGIYVLIVGPVNYIILRRINRRDWAWVTIPVFILIFSILAWTVGFNLRGNEITLSRLTVVQSWDDHDNAQVRQLIGLLSPRRDSYTLTVPDDGTITVLPGISQSGLLAGNITQANTDIVQTSNFSAENFTVDGGIFANFVITNSIEKPNISGNLVLSYNPGGLQSLQGAIRNDSDITLEDPIILARGTMIPLGQPLAPDDLYTLRPQTLTTGAIFGSAPSPMEYRYSSVLQGSSFGSFYTGGGVDQETLNNVMSQASSNFQNTTDASDVFAQTYQRDLSFLAAFLRDQYGSTARGDRAYLVGWTDEWQSDVDVVDVPWISIDTTLYIAELDVEVNRPVSSQIVNIPADQFTWVATERVNILDGGGTSLTMIPGSSVTMQFTPTSSAILNEVVDMQFAIDRSSGAGTLLVIEAWDYEAEAWVELTNAMRDGFRFTDPERYLSGNNSVRIRMTLDEAFTSVFIEAIRIEQMGYF